LARSSLTTARACAALLDIGYTVGFDTLSGRYARQTAAGQSARVRIAGGYVRGTVDLPKPEVSDLLPYEFYFNLRGVHRAPGSGEACPGS
jgi:hypothetical protein